MHRIREQVLQEFINQIQVRNFILTVLKLTITADHAFKEWGLFSKIIAYASIYLQFNMYIYIYIIIYIYIYIIIIYSIIYYIYNIYIYIYIIIYTCILLYIYIYILLLIRLFCSLDFKFIILSFRLRYFESSSEVRGLQGVRCFNA